MPTAIKFSAEYINLLKKFLSISKEATKHSSDRKESLLFYQDVNDNNNPKISLMDNGVLTHISTTPEHAELNDEFGVTKFVEFMNYIKALNYPTSGEISISEEKSTKGKDYSCVVLADDYVKYRMIVADPTEFDRKKDKKVPSSRDGDPLKLIASYLVSQEDLKKLTNDIRLMTGCDFFGLTVNNDVSYYMRGVQRQQVTRRVDPLKTKVSDTETLALDGIDKFRLFPTRIFNYMAYLGVDFEVEIRYLEPKDIVAFKAFGVIKNEGKDDIHVYIGATESTSQSMNNYDVIE